MSWKLLSVKGENFKYFRNSKSIPIEGKNLLIYGENGSGKSSLYWLLYTLLQAKMKPYKADRIKYFNSGNTENLRNKYSMDAEEMKISATWGEYDNQNHLIQQKETSLSINDFEGAESNFLYLTAQASDFINYKSLTQLFDFRNSQRCEWFDVFLQDVFPFVNFRNKLKKYNLQSYVSNCSKDWWDYLVTFQNKVPRIANGNVDEASGEYQYVVDSLTSYSAELNTLISDIEFACNTLLWDKFKMKVGLRIELNNPSYNNNLLKFPTPHTVGCR